MITRLNKIAVFVMCFAIIAVNVLIPLKVEAVKGAPYYSNKEIIDVSLTKTGVIANDEILTYTRDKVVGIMKNAVVAFQSFLVSRGEDEATVELFYEFIQSSTSDSVGGEVAKLLAYDLIDADYIVKLVNEYESDIEMNIDIYKMATGEDIEDTKNITLSNDLVDYIRELFNEYVKTNGDYFYIKTIGPDDLNPLWFYDYSEYSTFKEFLTNTNYVFEYEILLSQSNQIVTMGTDSSGKVKTGYRMYVYTSDFGLVDTVQYTNYAWIYKAYSNEWENLGYKRVSATTAFDIKNDTELASKMSSVTASSKDSISSKLGINLGTSTDCVLGIFTNDGRFIKVYKDLNTYKLASVGKDSYYITNDNRSYVNDDNSVTVGGDYISGTNYQYSHDVVQNQIDNSQNVDNSVVNNIVNNNQQTIVNNYSSSILPDIGNDSDNEDNDGGGGLLDGLGGLIGGITDFLGFIFGLLGDAISLVTSLFNTIFEGIKALGSVFTGFTGLLGDLFGFIPSELINFLVLAVEAGVAVTLWKQFKK